MALLIGIGCAKQEDVVVKTVTGKGLTEADLDRDPLALLPSGAVGMAYVDAQKLFASPFGEKLLAIARAQAPIPPAAGFEPRRDLHRLYVGFYSMQGADVAAVATGQFDKEAIERAVERTDQTPLGAPVVKSSYGGRTLYTSRNVGFSVLTAHTAVFGNETGIRRALDRIEAGRVTRSVPAYMGKLLDSPKAPIIVGVDSKSQPVSDAAREQFKFLNGLSSVRALGNFEAPGLNVAATLGYGDEQQAAQGAESVRLLRETLQSYGWVMSLLGIAQPIQKLEAKPQGKEAYVVVGVDGQVVGQLLDQLSGLLGVMAPAANSSAKPSH
jgi:hypothetical protein